MIKTVKEKRDKLDNIKGKPPILEIEDNPMRNRYQEQKICMKNNEKRNAFKSKVGGLEADILFTMRVIVAELLKNKRVQELIKNLELQIEEIDDMKTVMQTKAEIAKVNITIENTEIRNLLKEMHEFMYNSL